MRKKVLLVDDDPDDQYLTQRALKATGLDLDLNIAENGRDMLTLLQKNISSSPSLLPDLILLDLNMPAMDGITALKELRKLPLKKKIPIVVFTTSNSALDARESYDKGADFFLTKPGDFEELTQKIGELCKHWLEGQQ